MLSAFIRASVVAVGGLVTVGCATAEQATADIKAKPPVAQVVSTKSTDALVQCITTGLHKFDREVEIERREGGVTIEIGVMDQPQYLIDIDDVGTSRRMTFRRRTMLIQSASGPLEELVRRCAA